MIDAADMSGDGHPEGNPIRRVLALAGDDAAAKELLRSGNVQVTGAVAVLRPLPGDVIEFVTAAPGGSR